MSIAKILTMGEPAKRRATFEDLLAVPKNRVAEIIHGQLVTQSRPASLHARASSRLGVELDRSDTQSSSQSRGRTRALFSMHLSMVATNRARHTRAEYMAFEKQLVEIFRREEDGSWSRHEARPGGTALLASLSCELPVDDVYRDPLAGP